MLIMNRWSLYVCLHTSQLYNSNLIQFKSAEEISDHKIMSLFLVCLSRDVLMPIRQSRRKRKSNMWRLTSDNSSPPKLWMTSTADFSASLLLYRHPIHVQCFCGSAVVHQTTNCASNSQCNRYWPSTWQRWSPYVSCVSDSVLFIVTYCVLEIQNNTLFIRFNGSVKHKYCGCCQMNSVSKYASLGYMIRNVFINTLKVYFLIIFLTHNKKGFSEPESDITNDLELTLHWDS